MSNTQDPLVASMDIWRENPEAFDTSWSYLEPNECKNIVKFYELVAEKLTSESNSTILESFDDIKPGDVVTIIEPTEHPLTTFSSSGTVEKVFINYSAYVKFVECDTAVRYIDPDKATIQLRSRPSVMERLEALPLNTLMEVTFKFDLCKVQKARIIETPDGVKVILANPRDNIYHIYKDFSEVAEFKVIDND